VGRLAADVGGVAWGVACGVVAWRGGVGLGVGVGGVAATTTPLPTHVFPCRARDPIGMGGASSRPDVAGYRVLRVELSSPAAAA
jgi:hypothetical protein